MCMTVNDFKEMLDSRGTVILYDTLSSQIVFQGKSNEIPELLINRKFQGVKINKNSIMLNLV